MNYYLCFLCISFSVLQSGFSQRISATKCEEYRKRYQESGDGECRPSSTIIAEPLPTEFPALATLIYENGDHVKSNLTNNHCGGTLVSDDFVLTAASCLTKSLPKKVILGDLNASDREEVGIEEVVIHPDHTTHGLDNIALIRLRNRKVTRRGLKIWPACLPIQNRELADGAVVSAVGWESTPANFVPESPRNKHEWKYSTFPGANSRRRLQLTNVPIFPQQNCTAYFKLPVSAIHYRSSWTVSEDNLCAGEVVHFPGRRRLPNSGLQTSSRHTKTCQGDPGSSLYWSDPNIRFSCIQHIVGISSYGWPNYCGSRTPSVYTKVSSYLSWIENIVWP